MVLFHTENSFANSPTVKSFFAFIVIIISLAVLPLTFLNSSPNSDTLCHHSMINYLCLKFNMALKRNHARLMREKGRNYLCLAQNRIHHTRNMSNIHLMPFAEQSYAMRLSTHGVTGTTAISPPRYSASARLVSRQICQPASPRLIISRLFKKLFKTFLNKHSGI